MATVLEEKEKYFRMWQHKPYRRSSPGERNATLFRSCVQYERGDTLIDLGCGTGRGGAALAAKGFNAFLFDLVPSAVDDHVKLPFIEGNIWDLSGLPVFDWIYCTDVLEHVPPEQVDNTLAGMAAITRKGGFLTISHVVDGYGAAINERLHLTIEPFEWWYEKISRLWNVKEYERNHRSSWIVLGGQL